jgi:hypothetical protein
MAKRKIPSKLQVWVDARKRYRLTDAQIQMARELGLNPKKFGGYANHRQQRWKRPLGEYIEHLYFKRFKKTKPDRVVSIEERAEEAERKKEERKERKRLRRESELD